MHRDTNDNDIFVDGQVARLTRGRATDLLARESGELLRKREHAQLPKAQLASLKPDPKRIP
eukprot:13210459-Alexandrium_andersonii.AAC.1